MMALRAPQSRGLARAWVQLQVVGQVPSQVQAQAQARRVDRN